jgi:CheY-like chemotaxis protein
VRLPLHQGEIAHDEPAQGQGPLVLMVEDDPQAAALLSLQLTRGGFRIEQATSKTQAIDKALKLKPSAITLDIRLPEEGEGWKVLAQLKAQPETKEIPVVVVSVVDDPEAAAEAGAVAALVKPVDSEKLVRTLNQFVNENGRAH